MPSAPRSVLALCLGNICRSPIAEGLLRYHVQRLGLDIEIDSAGTSGYHAGESPDPRSVEVMRRHGHDISGQRSRQLVQSDLTRFDLILAMDQSNLRNACRLAQNEVLHAKVQLILDQEDVPDPYYGGDRGFDHVYQLIDEAVIRWVATWHP